MEYLEAIPLIGPTLAIVIPFVIVLSIVVAIHELGHLMVGRWCGIKAEVFSIGFGKVIWSRTDRRGTVWQVAALPLGGFVKFLGDMDPASAGKANEEDIPAAERHRAFHNAVLWKRTLTVLAGPVANFILSVLIFFCVALYTGKSSDSPVIDNLGSLKTEEVGFVAGDRVLRIGDAEIETFNDILEELFLVNGQPTPVLVERDGREVTFTTTYRRAAMVSGMPPDGAAVTAGLRPGDIVRKVDGIAVNSARDLQLVVANLAHNAEIAFEIEREGALRTIVFTPKLEQRKHPETGEEKLMPVMGVYLSDRSGLASAVVPVTISEAAYFSVIRVWRIIRDTVVFLSEMISNQGAGFQQLSGPIGIAKYSGDAAEGGLVALVTFTAFVSTAIGFFNLFPIPVLDGGHLCFYALEAVRRRPAPDVLVKYSTMAGLSLLLLLMVFVTFNNDLGLGDWFVQN